MTMTLHEAKITALKEKHFYTVKTYYDTTDEEHILKESTAFFANKYCIYDGLNYFFEERRKIEEGENNYICGFCKHKLRICGGQGDDKKQALHFRHFIGENKGCIYEEEKKLTKEEILRIKYNGAKESKKHEDYKNFIAERLLAMTTPKLAEKDVLIEKIYRNKSVPREWRRPDVLAKFPNKTVAFELQLSTTFLSVITERELFYQKQKIFIFWIFDTFSTESEEQLFAQKDILVSNVYNVFVLDQEAMERSIEQNTIYLKCHYADFQIKNGKILVDKMISKLVSLSELTFRETDYKVFYVDAIEQRNRLEVELKNMLKIDEMLKEIDDIYRWWNPSILRELLISIDLSMAYPKIKTVLAKIEECGSVLSIKNGILLIQLLSKQPFIDSREELKSELLKFQNNFKSIALNRRMNEIISLLEKESPRTSYEISTLSQKAIGILTERVQALITKIVEHGYCPNEKNLSMAHFIMQTGSDLLLSAYDRNKLVEIIEDHRAEEQKLLVTKLEMDIDYYVENSTLECFVDYYRSLGPQSQHLLIKSLLNRYERLLFHPTDEDNKNVYFYTCLLENPLVLFDIRLLFKDANSLFYFTEIERFENDSRQQFFSNVIYSLFKSGYKLSLLEQKKIKDEIIYTKNDVATDKSAVIKNKLLKYSLLQCYKQIQGEVTCHEQEQEYYKLLCDNWKFISRVLSVVINVVVGCDLPNMASVANNVKDYHLEYAHLFVLAAESQQGRKNEYKGKKNNDNLEKLKKEIETSPKYKKNEKLDKLLPILFPRVETFKSLK